MKIDKRDIQPIIDTLEKVKGIFSPGMSIQTTIDLLTEEHDRLISEHSKEQIDKWEKYLKHIKG